MNYKFIFIVSILICFTSFSLRGAARGETFKFSTGGEISGVLRNAGESPRLTYQLETTSGITFKCEKKLVEKMLHNEKLSLIEYRERAPFTAATPEAQWELALWCQENNLREEMELHLWRLVEIVPDHLEARKKLGQQKIDGLWTTREEQLAAKGLIRDKSKGRWRYQQELDIDTAKQEAKTKLAEWTRWLRQWRKEMETNHALRVSFTSINDPEAVPALAAFLKDEFSPEVRRLCILALGNINTPHAAMAIARWGVESQESSSDVLTTCVEQLKRNEHARSLVIDYLLVHLRSTQSERLNRAARFLGELGNAEVIPALIAALTSKQTRVINLGSGSPTFDPSAGSFGAGQTQITREEWVPNAGVQNALIHLTRQNLGPDPEAWKRYLRESHRVPYFNARRTF